MGSNPNPGSGSGPGSDGHCPAVSKGKTAPKIVERHGVFEKKKKQKNYSEVMDEQDRQKGKKTVKLDIGSKTYTIKNPYLDGTYELQDKLAKKLYDSIRDSDTDISEIAKNSILKEENVKKFKDHIFYNKHLLDQ